MTQGPTLSANIVSSHDTRANTVSQHRPTNEKALHLLFLRKILRLSVPMTRVSPCVMGNDIHCRPTMHAGSCRRLNSSRANNYHSYTYITLFTQKLLLSNTHRHRHMHTGTHRQLHSQSINTTYMAHCCCYCCYYYYSDYCYTMSQKSSTLCSDKTFIHALYLNSHRTRHMSKI